MKSKEINKELNCKKLYKSEEEKQSISNKQQPAQHTDTKQNRTKQNA